MRHEPITDWECERTETRPCQGNVTLEALGPRRRTDVGDWLRDLDLDCMRGPDSAWPQRRGMFEDQTFEYRARPGSQSRGSRLGFQCCQERDKRPLDARPEINPGGRRSTRREQGGPKNGLSDTIRSESGVAVLLEHVQQSAGILAVAKHEASSPTQGVELQARQLLCWLPARMRRMWVRYTRVRCVSQRQHAEAVCEELMAIY